ncbi:MAG TPA: tRNA lysidine(34) synthetase TilS [Flavobacteriaceae bacterium]|nr:tRNA lysidine(34) synthetase TilS [Flavobacteriaceae bacterium]
MAISGGIDSVVLAHLCKKASLDFSLAHCNFNLRGKESDEDTVFLEELSKKLGVPLFVEVFDTKKFAEENKLSIQVAARELRYDWFQKLSQTLGFDYVLTAHHANDNLETFLINTLRGTGLEGLTGIPEQNGNILRPLLPFSRKEIEAFAKTEKITWREDSSNASDKYLRNKIRHQIVPILEEENPQLLEIFANTQNHLQDASDLLKEYSKILIDEIVDRKGEELHFNIQKTQAKSNPKAVLYQLLKAYGFSEWENVTDLLSAQPGKMLFSATHRLVKDREVLILTDKIPQKNADRTIEITKKNTEVSFPFGKIKIEEFDNFHKSDKNEIYVEKNAIKFPLKLRKWKKGDYFYPFGMTGRKKVSDFLKNEKFSLPEKEKVWLLLSDNKIVWILGQRADNRFKVKENSQEILKITCLPKYG